MLDRIDDFLFDKVFQPCTDWIQSWAGLNNFHLAQMIGLWPCFLLWSTNWGICKILAIMCVVATTLFPPIYERDWETQPKEFLNPARIDLKGSREGLLKLLFFFGPIFFFFQIFRWKWVELAVVGSVLGLIIHLYFIGCTPKPPSTSKLRKMWNNLAQSISLGTPEPALVPARA